MIIPNAEVYINQQLIGKTNKSGEITFKHEYTKKGKLKIEISNKSEDFYFSPYFENLNLSEDNNQSFSITAVLYSVPKTNEKKKDPQEVTKTEIEDVAKTSPKVAEEKGRKLQEKVDLSKKYEKDEKTAEQPKIISIFTSHKNKELSDVEIYLQTKAKYIFVCKTIKGKCLSPLPQLDKYTIIAKKPGFKNYSKIFSDPNLNRIKIDIEKGNDINIQTLISDSTSTNKLANVKIYINKHFEGKTNDKGLFVKTLDHELGDIIDLKIDPNKKGTTDNSKSIVYSGPINVKKIFINDTNNQFTIKVLQPSIDGITGEINIDKEFDRLKQSLKSNMKKDINLKYVEEILRKKNEDKLVLKPTFFMTKNPMIQLELISKDGTTFIRPKIV